MAGSYTITFKDNGEGKGDGSSSMSSTNVADYVAEGAEYFSAVAATGKVFLGQDGYGLKFGNSSNAGSITLTLVTPVTPTSIVMNASPWSGTEGSGLLQDSTFATKSTGAKGTFADFTYNYDGVTEVTTIVVGTATKRGYVKSITVNFEGEGGEPGDGPTVLQAVKDSTTWDFSKITANTANALYNKEGIQLTDESEPSKNDEVIYADYTEDFMTIGEDFNKAAIAFKGEYPIRKNQYCQAGTLHFKADVAGTIVVKFSDTGSSASATAVKRYLVVNGAQTEYWTSRENNGETPYDAQLNVVSEKIAVPAGDVTITGSSAIVMYYVTFVPAQAVEPVLADTLTCAQAAELAAAGKTDEVIVKGYVTEIAYAWASGSMSFWMADTKDGGKVFEAYKCAIAKAEDAVIVGDLVAAKGNLTYYAKTSTPELAAGCTVEILEAVERPVVEPAQNLGAKTIAEFLTLKNTKDTCILTGVVANITNTTYGNFDLCDETDTVYIYGLLTPAGESQKFADLNVAEKDTLTVLAIYNEFNGKPQAKNAIFVEVKKYVEPVAEHTYTIAGSPATLFGTAWDPTNAANDMTLAEGIYKWEKKDIALAAGSIKFKVCEDHAWDVAYPAQDYELAIAEAGKYTITITFEPANENKVSATATKTADIVVLPNIVLHGNFSGNWADTDPFVAAQDSLTASLTLALTAGTFEFGFKFDGTWKANGANLTREANTANLSTGEGNMNITADVPGNYIFTYTYETQGVVVTYPEPIIVPDTVKIIVKEDLEWTDAVASQGWWQIMGENEGYTFSLSNSFTTEVPGIYTVEDLEYDYSFVKPKNGTDTIHFVSGQVVVAINTDSIITFVGALTGTDNKVYAFDLAYDPAAVNPYKYDEKDADFVYDFDSYELNTKYVAQGVVMISGETDSTSLGLIVYLPQGQTTLVAGEYPVAATPAYQTVAAGYYDAEYAFSGSMAATLIKQGDKLYYSQIWYLVSGKATVDANLNITVDALNSNSKLIKANLKAEAQGIEDVKAAKKATKSLKNGILVIEKNGVQYNVTGQEIR